MNDDVGNTSTRCNLKLYQCEKTVEWRVGRNIDGVQEIYILAVGMEERMEKSIERRVENVIIRSGQRTTLLFVATDTRRSSLHAKVNAKFAR